MRGKSLYLVTIILLPALTFAQEADQKYELGGLLTGTFLRQIGTRDVGVGTDAAGLGGRFVYHAIPFVDLETEWNFLPGNSATSGNHVQAFFGAKSGVRWSRFGLFLKARPGFIHFRRDPFGVPKPGAGLFSYERATSTERSGDVGGVIEYATNRGPIVRFDLADTVIRYHTRTVRVSDFVPSVQAGGFTTHNWQGSLGLSFRF